MNFYPDVEITVENQAVIVHLKRNLIQEESLTEDIQSILMEMYDIKDVRINIIPVLEA